MDIKHQLSNKNHRLTLAIRRACYTIGFLGSLTSPLVYAANPIERSSTHAFSIPNDVISEIETGPVITTLDGKNYIQFISRTQQENTYQNIIAGPIDKLLDKTIPWDNLIYSSNSFTLTSSTYPLGSLADLNNDGINTLISESSEYDINNSLTLITDNVFTSTANLDSFSTAPVFIDVDNDDDLDMFISNFKYGGTEFYENAGSTEAYNFIHQEANIRDILDRYLLTLPTGFLEFYNSQFINAFSAGYDTPVIFDFDTDGDQDILMSDQHPGTLTYFEQSKKDTTPIYTEPFSVIPSENPIATWITDFDMDGDLDYLLNPRHGELQFFEKIDNHPNQYANPVTITNFPHWTGIYYFGAPSASSTSRSKEIFKDIDNDGIQEMLVIQSSDYKEFQLLLLKKREDNSFEQQLIYHGDEINYGASCSMQFIDANDDGKYDIALHFSYADADTDETQPILLFEQQDPSTFTGPITLASDALNLNRSWANHLEVDLDHDGDIDNVYNHSVTWNLESNPGSITNFSTRSYVGEGPNILIGGFIIEGKSPQTVILRGIGPSLNEMGVRTPLTDPALYLFSGDKLIASNDDWQSLDDADKIEAAGIGLDHPNEAAIRMRLDPGTYTVHLKGSPMDTGVGIIAIDSDNQMPSNSLQVNISGRALVTEGENITIGGFIIEGDTPVKVLIRGLGPQLQEHGVDNSLINPNITLFSGNNIIASNDDWKSNTNAAEIAALENAPSYDEEAAILTELQPGTYTVHLRGAPSDTGVGIIAIDRP